MEFTEEFRQVFYAFFGIDYNDLAQYDFISELRPLGEPAGTMTDEDTGEEISLVYFPAFTVYGKEGSTAQAAAEASGVRFVVHEAHTPGEAARDNETPATCAAPGQYDAVVSCSVCGEALSREHVTVDPLNHRNAAEAAATEATATGHGYTAGVYCADCDTWLSGHEVIHNTLGDCEILREPTATEPGECRITCTVCGEQGLYAMEPVPHEDPQPGENEPEEPDEPEDNTPMGRIRRAMKSIIEFFLRLLKWFSKDNMAA